MNFLTILDPSISLPFAATASSHSDLTWPIVGLIITLVLAAVSSASETSLTSVNRIRIRNLAEEGDVRAQQIETLLQSPGAFLNAILVVNTVALLVASALTTSIAFTLHLPYAETVLTILLSIFTLVFCEITPKSAAVQNAESWARALIPYVRVIAWLLGPIVPMLRAVSAAILAPFGISLKRTGPSVTEEELMLLVNVGEEEGVLEEEERSMIHSIFELSDTTVREVMVPRIDMVTMPAETTIAQAVDIVIQGGFSRIPVYAEKFDNVIGVLYAKDMLRETVKGDTTRQIRDFVRPAYDVPESKKLDDLLHEMRIKHIHMAIVFDEYGAVSGLVTIEDLVEEIVGDIQDEYDREEKLYERINACEYIVDAKMNIDDFNELVGTDLEAGEEYDTVGGFVLTTLDKIPNVNDVVEAKGAKLTVLATRGRRITKIKAELLHPNVDHPSADDQSRHESPPSEHDEDSHQPLSNEEHAARNGNHPPSRIPADQDHATPAGIEQPHAVETERGNGAAARGQVALRRRRIRH